MRWKQLVEVGRRDRSLRQRDDQTLVVTRQYRIAGVAVEQEIVATRRYVGADDWLVLTAPVDHLIGPLAALAHNATLALGAVCLVGNDYVLRAGMPLIDCSPFGLARAVHLLGHEAARLRHHAGTVRRSCDFFTAYAE